MSRPTDSLARRLFRRHVAVPSEHGAWVFLLSPMIIGFFAGGRWTATSFYLVVAALAAFLVRHPLTLAIKAYAGRRGRDILPAAWFWTGVYAAVGLLHVAGLILRGFGHLLLLAVPGIPVLAWYLRLVSQRQERRQWLVQIVASGTLALGAPAAFWVGVGRPDPMGWLLWALTWAQSVASIMHAHLRLEQRTLLRKPSPTERWRLSAPAVGITSLNLAVVIGLGLDRTVPPWLFVPYALQWIETLWGAVKPAVGHRPTAIGLRQLAVSTLFTLLFVLTWR